MDIAVVYSVQTCQSHICRKGKLIPSMLALEFTYRKGEAFFMAGDIRRNMKRTCIVLWIYAIEIDTLE
jgi:hypothetical protein